MTQQVGETKSRPMTGPLKGLPLPNTEHPDYALGFWEGTRQSELRIQQCADCKKYRHLPSPMCPHCHSLQYQYTKVSGRGTVYSYMIPHHPLHPALREGDQLPYNVALIELEEQSGLRILSNILQIPAEDICIGMPVEVTFMPTEDDVDVVLPLFIPIKK